VIVDAEPQAFLRGLIHTDGWRGLNRVRVKGKDYAYPRYQFSNRSDDIRKLFTGACEKLGVEWRQWTGTTCQWREENPWQSSTRLSGPSVDCDADNSRCPGTRIDHPSRAWRNW
jgi:hypothetical protein